MIVSNYEKSIIILFSNYVCVCGGGGWIGGGGYYNDTVTS